MNELFTCQGKYLENEPIQLTLKQDTAADRAEWHVWHLEKEIMAGSVPTVQRETALLLPPLKEGGYGVEVRLFRQENLLLQLYTAVNVGGDAVRYGFLCDFEREDEEAVSALAKYHITHVQFYDWSWRHDSLISPDPAYQDMMGKHNALPVIQKRVEACHRHGMLAMAYGAVYAASRPFWESHRDWGLYSAAGQPMTFIRTFYYMDIDSPWRAHLMREYRKAITEVGFDGIHMDTYGEPKSAWSKDGQHRFLRDGFPRLIRDTHDFLSQSGIQPHLIFNNVGTWPADATKDCPQDAVYMELWPPMDRYHHLREAVRLAGDHPVVLAAYPTPFRTDAPERALYSQLLLSFAIAMQGATQLFIGEGNAVTTQGYYADYTLLSADQIPLLRSYEDFFVQYGDLLYDRSLKDVTCTHFGGDNAEYRVDQPCSADGEPDKLWITIRENEKRKMIGFVNLCGNQDERWNAGKNRPIIQKAVALHILVDQAPAAVWFATPDAADKRPQQLEYTVQKENYGLAITCVIPFIFCCGLIWVGF